MAPSGTEQSERGPGWYDVWNYMRAMEKTYGRFVEVVVSPNVGRNNSWGLYVTARFREEDSCHGHGCYGPSYPGNGQKTVAAAYYHALVRLDAEMSARWARGEREEQEELPF